MNTSTDTPGRAPGSPPALPPGVAPVDVAATIGAASGSATRRWLRTALLVLVALVAAGAAAWWFLGRRSAAPVLQYQTEPASRGALVVQVSATGKLQPTTQVDVGSELSGTIEAVLVQDNDRVRTGQVLARLDTAKLRDTVARSEASVTSAQAAVQLQRAAGKEAQGNLERLQEAWKLSGGRLPSRAEMATAEAAVEKAAANAAAAEAALVQAQATLRSDRTNVDKASIRSPIDGVVLLRKVEPGQTVAASLQAPVLFTLAQSLTQMELQVNIDEADVGQVREGQKATFGVDAYPDRSYPAVIRRVRYGSETTNGVVTYRAVLQAANEDLSLRPGMTGSARITTLERGEALRVPNAALRWAPPASADAAASGGRGVTGLLIPRPPSGRVGKTVRTVVSRGSEQTVWVLDGGTPRAVRVTVDASDGRHTEVTAGALKSGDAVIVDASEATR